MKRTLFVFSGLAVAVLCLFQLGKYRYLSGNTPLEVVLGLVAVVFFAIGLFLSPKKKPSKSRETSEAEVDLDKIAQLGLSKREYEVLLEIANGLSNKEIADKLFVTESTIKTHVSNILLKLDAKRRIQAVQNAQKLQILKF
ncbi:MAG: response regulator transcription factor [Bacteroidota bacterium]